MNRTALHCQERDHHNITKACLHLYSPSPHHHYLSVSPGGSTHAPRSLHWNYLELSLFPLLHLSEVPQDFSSVTFEEDDNSSCM